MTPAESWLERFKEFRTEVMGHKNWTTCNCCQRSERFEEFVAQELKAAVGIVELDKTYLKFLEDQERRGIYTTPEITTWKLAIKDLESAKANVLKNLGIEYGYGPD